MAKLEKDALLSKIGEKVLDEELAIELMGDISDSMGVVDTSEKDAEISDLKSKLETKTKEYENLRAEYKARFLEGSPDKGKEIKEPEGLKEKVVYDLKEI